MQGQCFIAVDPDSFMPGFEERMSDLMGICRNQEPVSDLYSMRRSINICPNFTKIKLKYYYIIVMIVDNLIHI